ncbi:MAG TPA: cytochrome C oxidase subunit IV family protein [Polyangiaceae bacterium]|nr:cytochrome C oxidase subunit IV family protein [Polyangiaceae bacterium]
MPTKHHSERRSAIAPLAAGALLLILAVASYGLSFVSLGFWALPIALSIAALKACIVVSIFMELRRETASIQLTALMAALLLLILVALTAADVATRGR